MNKSFRYKLLPKPKMTNNYKPLNQFVNPSQPTVWTNIDCDDILNKTNMTRAMDSMSNDDLTSHINRLECVLYKEQIHDGSMMDLIKRGMLENGQYDKWEQTYKKKEDEKAAKINVITFRLQQLKIERQTRYALSSSLPSPRERNVSY